jgi:hypothetical protein
MILAAKEIASVQHNFKRRKEEVAKKGAAEVAVAESLRGAKKTQLLSFKMIMKMMAMNR